ncbi:MAG: hypothetical protein AAF989_04405, partial [Planctomycetota bacterium]
PTQPEARALLDYGDRLHNLCIAPYEYVHSLDYTKRVFEILEAAEAQPGDKVANVVAALDFIRGEIEHGRRL